MNNMRSIYSTSTSSSNWSGNYAWVTYSGYYNYNMPARHYHSKQYYTDELLNETVRKEKK